MFNNIRQIIFCSSSEMDEPWTELFLGLVYFSLECAKAEAGG
jgi:hypothetical protein